MPARLKLHEGEMNGLFVNAGCKSDVRVCREVKDDCSLQTARSKEELTIKNSLPVL